MARRVSLRTASIPVAIGAKRKCRECRGRIDPTRLTHSGHGPHQNPAVQRPPAASWCAIVWGGSTPPQGDSERFRSDPKTCRRCVMSLMAQRVDLLRRRTSDATGAKADMPRASGAANPVQSSGICGGTRITPRRAAHNRAGGGSPTAPPWRRASWRDSETNPPRARPSRAPDAA